MHNTRSKAHAAQPLASRTRARTRGVAVSIPRERTTTRKHKSTSRSKPPAKVAPEAPKVPILSSPQLSSITEAADVSDDVLSEDEAVLSRLSLSSGPSLGLQARSGTEQQQQQQQHPSPLPPLSSTTKTTTLQGMNISSITHRGRHSGALEAQKIGVPADHVQIAGRWADGSGRMQQCNLDNYPIDVAFALAGFMDHPFHLRRCEVHPSNELQMMIFPFIESALFEEGSVERREWIQKCKEAMEEKVSEAHQPNHTTHVEQLRDIVAAIRSEDNTSQFTRQQFLLMLVRMRRVVLQDAAEYLRRFKYLRHPVLLKPMFHSTAFKAYQAELLHHLRRPEPAEIQQWPVEAILAFKHNEEALNNLNREMEQCRTETFSRLQERTAASIQARSQALAENR
ncbi:hypothetical protein BGW41_004756 [Actinomortierella wolfii]|nr:hypothetical protein BGW41_004756 [Actinomortierella wolfii]